MIKNRLEERLDSIPAPIATALRQLLRRTRKVMLVRGLCAVAAVLVVMTLIAMGLDAGLLIVSPLVRWTISASIYVAAAAATYFFLVVPLARSYSLAGVAQMIEAHHPEMQERLSSAVELLTNTDAPDLRGSQKLIDALAEAATADARRIRPKNEISMKAAVPFFAVAAGAMLVMAAIFAIFPKKAPFLLARATAPFANLPNVMALDLVVKPGDVFVPRGESLDINLASAGAGIRKAKIQRILDDGRVASDDMRRRQNAGGAVGQEFAYAVSSVENSFKYRIQADDAVTRYYNVTAVTPPVIESLDLKIDYPEYASLPSKTETASGGTISALAGSVATINLKVNKRCHVATMKIEGSSPLALQGEQTVANGACHVVFRIPLTPGLAGIYSLSLVDEHGLKNAKYERAVQALPDIPPVAVITDLPQKEIRLRPDDRFPFYFFATDDVGLKAVEIMLEKDSVKIAPHEIALPQKQNAKENLRKFEGKAELNLADSDLRGVRRLVFQVAATDGLPVNLKGPQRGVSEQYVIVIDENAKSFKEQALRSQEEALKNQLQQAKKELEESKQKLPFVNELAAKNEKRPEQLPERVAVLRENIANGDATLKALAEKLSEGFFDDVSRKINELHDKEIAGAKNMTDRISLSETPEERKKLLEDVSKNLDKSIAAIDEMLKKADVASKAMERAVEIENLAHRQEDLAKRKLDIDKLIPDSEDASKIDPAVKKQMDEWKQQQDRLADTLAKLAREQLPDSALKNSARLKEAGRISDEARKLLEEQKGLEEAAKKIADMQNLDKKLGALVEQQNAVADLAKSNLLTKPATSAMHDAAEQISKEKLDDAVKKQDEAISAVKDAVRQLEKEKSEDPWKRSGSPAETVKALADKAKAAGEAAIAAVEKAKAAEKSVQDEAAKFEKSVKDAGNVQDQDRKNAMEEKKSLFNELAQKAKEALSRAEQNSKEAQNFAKETADIARKLPADKAGAEAEKLVRQAEEKAHDADQKAMVAGHSAKSAELAAKMAADLNNMEEGGKNYQAEPVRQAAALAKKAVESAKSAEEAVAKAEKALDGTSKNIEALQKVQRDAEKNGQKERAKEIAGSVDSARQDHDMAKRALDGARQAANASKQNAEQAKQQAEAASRDQNRRNAAGQALESMRKATEAVQQSELAENNLRELASDDRSAREEMVGELAKAQDDLKDRTAELMKEKKDSMDASIRERAAQLEKRQGELAAEAAKIAAQVGKESPAESKLAEQAQENAGKAKDSLKGSDLPSAAKNAAKAARELNALADKLESAAASQIGGKKNGSESSGDSSVSHLAKHAGEVAEQQDMLRKEIDALANGTQLENLSAQQENIEKKVEDLKKEAEAFLANARELNLPQRGQQLAAEGQNSLQNALQSEESAGKTMDRMLDESRKMKQDPSKQLSGHLPNELKQAQSASSKSLEQAAAKMAEAQNAIDDAAKNLPSQQSQSSEGEQSLPAASGLARKAAVEQSAIDAIQSAESLNAASREAMAMAAKAGMNTSPGKMSSVAAGGRNEAQAQKAPPGFDVISRRLGIRYEDWLKLPGNLRSEILQSSANEGPEEYREIIRRYFEELSKRGMEGK